MPINAVISFAAAYFSLTLAAVVLFRDKRSLVHQIFAVGMVLLALEEVFRGLGYRAILPQDVLFWHKRAMGISSLLPGTWLLFSISYARLNYRDFLSRWKWITSIVLTAPILLVTYFRASLLTGPVLLEDAARWTFTLGWSGNALNVLILLASVLIVLNLERTVRASSGRMRWQIKFMALGVGGLFALRIYLSSQALLFSKLDTGLGTLNAVALLAANVLFIRSLSRARSLNVDVYLSGGTIQRSLTVLLAGIYLLIVGFLAHFARYFSRGGSLPIDAFLVFLALTALAVLLLSDRLRQRLKRFVSRHFTRPMYDYRNVWMELTQRTMSLVDIHELCTAVAKMVAEALEVLSVNVWLLDETKGRLALAGSTVFSRSQSRDLESGGDTVTKLIGTLHSQLSPIDLRETRMEWADEIMRRQPEFFRESKIRYAIPLRAGKELVGLITLNEDLVGEESLSVQDLDLLLAFSAQLAANVLNLKLSERLREAKETEAFQSVSAFFVHDLKNLASRLSLTMQNLPIHFDKPEFRADALRVISQSLAKINDMCNRLSMVKQRIDVKMTEDDLNAMVSGTLDDLESSLKVPLVRELGSLPKVSIDREQLQKVLTNLILNASEAVDGQGTIRVETARQDSRVVLSVSDAGCGMSDKFIEESLFRPFRTTKKQGLGIGLFHSKLIIEAHRGRIEVESNEGKGSVFRVVLPAHLDLTNDD
jgi:putative PEP-CTERM system histidine kinase